MGNEIDKFEVLSLLLRLVGYVRAASCPSDLDMPTIPDPAGVRERRRGTLECRVNDPADITGIRARQCSGSMPTASQASGGARDWNGARCGATKATATRSTCSIASETSRSDNCGASATDEALNR
jgi:hypothetical protein